MAGRSPRTTPSWGLALLGALSVAGCKRGKVSPAQDIRAPKVQDTGTIGAAFVEQVEARQAGASRSAGRIPTNLWAEFRFRHDGDWVRSSAVLGGSRSEETPDAESVTERWFLVAYAPSDPRLSYLLSEWPISELRTVTASVTAVTRRRIPKGDRFALERETGVRRFAYRIDGERYEAEEHIGPAEAAAVGQTVTAMVRRDDPKQARIVDPSVLEAMRAGEMYERGRALKP